MFMHKARGLGAVNVILGLRVYDSKQVQMC